ncbi:hypothetical protein B0H17DRAFT_917397, partial [Mycena rosella]
SSRFRRLSLFNNPKPSCATMRMYNNLTRPQASILTQLRTTHIGLNAYLYRFHLAPSLDCDLCLVPETVSHFLLARNRYHCQYIALILRLGTANFTL